MGRESIREDELYAARVLDLTLDEWLREVTGLVSALAASEFRLAARLRRLRGEMESGSLGVPHPSPPLGSLPFEPRRLAPPAAVTATPLGVDADRAVEMAAPGRDGNPSTATSTARSYDYFAELDEKLAVLHRSGPEIEGD
jgi:hypothetical protein